MSRPVAISINVTQPIDRAIFGPVVFGLGTDAPLAIAVSGLADGSKIGLSVRAVDGTALFGVHDLSVASGVATGRIATSTVQAVAKIGTAARLPVMLYIDTSTTVQGVTDTLPLAVKEAVLLEDGYIGNEPTETIEEVIEAAETATEQAVIATEQAVIATDQAVIATEQAVIATEQADAASQSAEAAADSAEAAAGMLSTKMDKLLAPEGNFVLANDPDGNAQQTLVTKTELEAMPAAIAGKADKVPGATSGHVAALDENGNIIDGGYPASSIGNKADIVPTAGGNLAAFEFGGQLKDSGIPTDAPLLKAAQTLDASERQQVWTNLGMGDMTPIVSANPPNGTFRSAGTDSGIQTSFIVGGIAGSASTPSYADIYAHIRLPNDNDTGYIAALFSGTVQVSATITRTSATTYNYGGVSVAAAKPILLSMTCVQLSVNNFTTTLFVNGTQVAQATMLSSPSYILKIGSAVSGSYGWIQYLPGRNYWVWRAW